MTYYNIPLTKHYKSMTLKEQDEDQKGKALQFVLVWLTTLANQPKNARIHSRFAQRNQNESLQTPFLQTPTLFLPLINS